MAQVPSLKCKNAELTTTSMIDLVTYMVLGNLVEVMLLHDSFGFCISPKKKYFDNNSSSISASNTGGTI